MPELTWDDAIVEALKQAGEALHYTDIVDKIAELQLRKDLGPNPNSVVSTRLSIMLAQNTFPIRRVRRGEYIHTDSIKQQEAVAQPIPDGRVAGGSGPISTEIVEETGLVTAFGMYWKRGGVKWCTSPQLLGKQRDSNVDFTGQQGVYVLHDMHRPIYVGQAEAERLGKRLNDHTRDRLASRWDRFSWFGLLPVDSTTGKLGPSPITLSTQGLLTTLEALLMEVLETPLNRRRGDFLSSIEWFQVEDPEIHRESARAILSELSKKI